MIREHTFDGIEEYDKRLPNWWLATFYGAIAFWIGYWFYVEQAQIALSPEAAIELELSRIEAAKLAANSANLDDATLWQMSRNAVFVNAGRETFNSVCASCHLQSLKGVDEGGIGHNLVDDEWAHGGNPTDILAVINNGVLAKGMPAWGPVIGAKKTSEVIAYILSHHTEPAHEES
ncbi:cytochrome C oxidase subunit III [Cephaloticoccus capnophilus]|uniref:Cytochrome C oxidase subunit III n=1 Tax=Cephaloticoccus capnophilus TaxID=1548208 RepID=A0A139ST01_9BACT|nr:cytochrome C oxidase subunit III [Cephaloticoccus capnophilus]